MTRIATYSFTKVFLAGALVATYGCMLLSYIDKKRHGGTLLDAARCVAEPQVSLGQLCKCSNCGMKEPNESAVR